MSADAPARWDRARSAIEPVPGWLTAAQARRLWDAAGSLRAPAQIVEIGSFRGRSTIVLALAAADGVHVVAIDPHLGGDRGPQEYGDRPDVGEADHEAFAANLQRAGVAGRVRHVRPQEQSGPGTNAPGLRSPLPQAPRYGTVLASDPGQPAAT